MLTSALSLNNEGRRTTICWHVFVPTGSIILHRLICFTIPFFFSAVWVWILSLSKELNSDSTYTPLFHNQREDYIHPPYSSNSRSTTPPTFFVLLFLCIFVLVLTLKRFNISFLFVDDDDVGGGGTDGSIFTFLVILVILSHEPPWVPPAETGYGNRLFCPGTTLRGQVTKGTWSLRHEVR